MMGPDMWFLVSECYISWFFLNHSVMTIEIVMISRVGLCFVLPGLGAV